MKRVYDYLEIDDFERIVNALIAIRETFSEDIPAFHTRYAGKLEGIIAQVQANYFGKEQYPNLHSKAAFLFYALIKNHPFFNGNKRVAVVALFEFLKRNALEVYLDEQTLLNDLFELAIYTSESSAEDFKKVMNRLKRKIKIMILD